jgi:hypothetical protein
VLEQHMNNERIVAQACKLLLLTGYRDEERSNVRAYHGVAVLVAVLRQQIDSKAVVKHCCDALSFVLEDTDNCSALVNCNGIAALIKALTHHIEDKFVVHSVCCALRDGLCTYDNLAAFGTCNGAAVIIKVLEQHSDRKVFEAACQALEHVFTTNHNDRSILIDAGASITVLVKLLQQYVGNDELAQDACQALSQALVYSCGKLDATVGIPALVNVLETHIDSTLVLEEAFAVVMNSVWDDDNRTAFGLCNGVPLLVRMLEPKFEREWVIELTCGVLQAVTHCHTNADTFRACNGFVKLVSVMTTNAYNEALIQNVCAAAASATANNVANIREFAKCHGLRALMDILNIHIESDAVMEHACSLVYNVSACRAACWQLKSLGALDLLKQVRTRWSSDEGHQSAKRVDAAVAAIAKATKWI